jgi:hypothetical protein
MKARPLGPLFRLLLVTTGGAGSMAACGGGIVTVDDGTRSPGANDDSPPPTSTPTAPARRDASVPDSRVPDVMVRPDRWDEPECACVDVSIPTCKTGIVDPDSDFCCGNPPGPGCVSGGADAQCGLDCNAVCARVAPGTPTGFQQCYWTASGSDPKIGYACGACGVGRVPSGTRACTRGRSVADRLAMQAYYEAASIVAFDRLADFLENEGAPERLVAAVRSASADESRHAALFARLASDRGARVHEPSIQARPSSMLELALENTTEGCVRETYGALVALHQSEHARDAELRSAFRSVAADEIAHAELSWMLAEWFDARLSTDDRARVRAAHTAAKEALRPRTRADDVDVALGIPSGARAAALYEGLFGALRAPLG